MLKGWEMRARLEAEEGARPVRKCGKAPPLRLRRLEARVGLG